MDNGDGLGLGQSGHDRFRISSGTRLWRQGTEASFVLHARIGFGGVEGWQVPDYLLSGSEKSTLIRHLNRLIEPTIGEILVHGEDAMKLSVEGPRRLRQTKISVVFESFALLPHWTALRNTAPALQARGEDEKRRAAR